MIHYFNPGHEMAVKNGSPYYTAPANVVTMKKDLSFLPAWYAGCDDRVLADEGIDTDFCDKLSEKLKFGVEAIGVEQLRNCSGMEIALWGIAPQGIRFFEEINNQYTLDLIIPKWDDEFVYLNSRQSARDILKMLIDANPSLSADILPRFFSSLEDIEVVVGQSLERLLAKAPYSSSGRGLLWLPVDELTRTERQILNGMLNKQQIVSVERVLDRQVDFAMEFASDGAGGVQFVGYSLFETNKKGAYLGNILSPQSDIESYLGSMIDRTLLDKVKSDLQEIMSRKYISYKGYLGVDMMVYKEKDEYKLHPCVEVNMRSNMGVLAINIQQNYLLPQVKGKFYIDFSAKDGDAYAEHLKMEQMLPSEFENYKLKKGYMALCPVFLNSHYRAYVIVD